jgi:hypothetical protein
MFIQCGHLRALSQNRGAAQAEDKLNDVRTISIDSYNIPNVIMISLLKVIFSRLTLVRATQADKSN